MLLAKKNFVDIFGIRRKKSSFYFVLETVLERNNYIMMCQLIEACGSCVQGSCFVKFIIIGIFGLMI